MPTGDAPRVFVALASYCDPELAPTIEDCLARARRPDRLRFGVLHQFDVDGVREIREDALDHLAGDDRFRIATRDHREARGGCWARHAVQGLYEGEEYTLQVDADTRFVDDWDLELLRVAEELGTDRPLITGFPPAYSRGDGADVIDRDDRDRVPTVRVTRWSEEGWIEHPTEVVDHGVAAPRRTRVISGALVFAPGSWVEDVRQDPGHIYTGEEFALTLRSYTHGYDLFEPPRVVVWHRHHPEGSRRWIGDFAADVRHRRATARLRVLLAGDPAGRLGRYSLGRRRTLEDYRRFSGLDCANRTIHADAHRGIPPDPVTIG